MIIEPAKQQSSERTEVLTEAIQKALRVVPPLWPLQNAVAVNPFWFMRSEKFESALERLEKTSHASFLKPKQGQQHIRTFSEHLASTVAGATSVDEFVILDLGKHCAGFFDRRQASAKPHISNSSFWQTWLRAQEDDKSLQYLGGPGYQTILAKLKSLDSNQAIVSIINNIGLTTNSARGAYLERLTYSVLGWASQFQYAIWQKTLGVGVKEVAPLVDLLAVRLVYDYVLFEQESLNHNQACIQTWRKTLQDVVATKASAHSDAVVDVFESEKRFQRSMKDRFNFGAAKDLDVPAVQMVFCIDVRSETLRRNIEQVDSSIQTKGFAGFFGLAFGQKRNTSKLTEARLPVLLAPHFFLEEERTESRLGLVDLFKRAIPHGRAVLRLFRKNSLSSLMFVEFSGLFYFVKLVNAAFPNLFRKSPKESFAGRFDFRRLSRLGEAMRGLGGETLTLLQKTDQAEGILRHMGLTENFAPLVVFVGHGSHTTNNAFGSSLDCGACGGHSGEVNACLLADLLNDQDLRRQLDERGISIPAATRFLGGIHETVSDQIILFESGEQDLERASALLKLQQSLDRASKACGYERGRLLNQRQTFNHADRSIDWGQTRPEWALAGNAAFVVAPRERTLGQDLRGRSFLHDYDWRKDQTTGYKTLELIMTAPMVVTNWINMQYFASTQAPQVYGSGNKVLHNLTNEVGVVEGCGGDLRIGLPLQSVHDGDRFLHEPLRLSVFIEAPQQAIEDIIAKHEVVRELVGNGWLHLLQIEPAEGKVFLRSTDGVYAPI